MKRKKRMRKIRFVQRQSMRLSMKQTMVVATTLVGVLTVALIIFLNVSNNKNAYAFSSGDYRSKASGSWSSTATWEKYNGSSWIAATTVPSSSDGIVTIQAGHSVTSSSNVQINGLIVETGATLTISSNTLSVQDGNGTDATIKGTLNIAGTFLIASNGSVDLYGTATLKTSGTLSFNNSSSLMNVYG